MSLARATPNRCACLPCHFPSCARLHGPWSKARFARDESTWDAIRNLYYVINMCMFILTVIYPWENEVYWGTVFWGYIYIYMKTPLELDMESLLGFVPFSNVMWGDALVSCTIYIITNEICIYIYIYTHNTYIYI